MSEVDRDPVTGRPMWHGLPVPYVAWWTGETVSTEDTPRMVTTPVGLWSAYGYPERHPLGLPLMNAILQQRDEHGVLWWRSAKDAQGVGEPQFGEMHTGRQRQCMMERRCQVCGTYFPSGTPITFMAERASLTKADSTAGLMTAAPPVCEVCIPASASLCPFQRQQDVVVVRTDTYKPFAVLADTFSPATGPVERVILPLGSPRLHAGVAKQLFVTVDGFDVMEVNRT